VNVNHPLVAIPKEKQTMRKVSMLLLLVSICCLAMPAMAQTGGGVVSTITANWTVAAACIAMAIASGLCGLGQGRATASATEALARNPAAGGAIQTALILGLALIESLALYTLLIVFIKVK
jgi:F-type H+-transporting ATPase subunit c